MSRDILSGLPDATRGEIISFMTFFKGERARTLEALDGDFEDCLEDRIRGVDPPFSLEDVTSAVDHLQVVVKDGVERDLKKIVNMNVLLLKNLLATAQQRGVRLRVDTSVIEDEALLRQVDALKLTGGSFSPAEPKGPSASFDDLTSKEEQKALERTNDRLVADNNTLQKDLRRLQAQSERVWKSTSVSSSRRRVENWRGGRRDDFHTGRSRRRATRRTSRTRYGACGRSSARRRGARPRPRTTRSSGSRRGCATPRTASRRS